MLISSCLLAFCVSIDSFSIGITYGLKNTNISKLAKLILFSISIFFTLLSTAIGSTLKTIFSELNLKIIGSIILIGIGLWIFFQSLQNSNNSSPFDLDKSNNIDWKEAIFLGLALSIDSIGVGISSSFIGINPYIFALLVATFQLIFLSLGKSISSKIMKRSNIPENIWSVIASILLIIIGITKVLT